MAQSELRGERVPTYDPGWGEGPAPQAYPTEYGCGCDWWPPPCPGGGPGWGGPTAGGPSDTSSVQGLGVGVPRLTQRANPLLPRPDLNDDVIALDKQYVEDSQGMPAGGGACPPPPPCPPGPPPPPSGECPCGGGGAGGDGGGLPCACMPQIDHGHGNIVLFGALPLTRSVPLEVTWTYSVANPESSPFGFGWASSLLKKAEHLYAEGEHKVYIYTEGGPTREYIDTGGLTFQSPPGIFTTLKKSGLGLIEETIWGRKWRYGPTGRLLIYTDRRGNVFTYSYDDAGRLTTVTAPLSQVYTLAYDANDYVESITDPAGRETLFSVDANGDLVSFTTPNLCVTK